MMKRREALAIVAHPDDETIWMGGTIMQNPNFNWTILSLTRESDSDRAPKFREVCKFFNAVPIITDMDDESDNPLSISFVSNLIKKNIPNKNFDFIFTHGNNGEYGHIRHEDIHNAVTSMFNNNELSCDRLMNFSYSPGNIKAPHDQSLSIPIANKHADWVIELTPEQHKKKLDLIISTYGYIDPIFETLACGKIEAFTEVHK